MTDSGWFGIVGILEHFLICLVSDSGLFGIVAIRQPVAFFSMMHNDAKQFTCLFSFICCPTLFEGVYLSKEV